MIGRVTEIGSGLMHACHAITSRRICRARVAALALLLLVAQAAIAGMPVYETRYYRVHTDVERDLARDLCARLDAMADEYGRRLSNFGAKADQRFEVHIFRRQQDYLDFTQNRFPNTGGVFMSSRNTLAAFLEGQGRDGLRRTLQHEAFHQFAHTRIGGDIPVWLNEGLAQVFEEGVFDGRRFLVGQAPPRRIRQLQHDMKNSRLTDFRTFLNLSNGAWQQNLSDPDRAATQYTQAWAMAHFLIFAGDGAGGYRYRDRLLRVLTLIHKGVGGTEAFEQCFGTNLEGFQNRFVEYARSLQPTAEAAELERQEVLSDMLVELHQRGQRFDSTESLRKYLLDTRFRIDYRRGALQWRSDSDINHYFRGPDGAMLSAQQLFFATRAGAPMDDLVRHPPSGLKLRTVFYGASGKIDRETIVE